MEYDIMSDLRHINREIKRYVDETPTKQNLDHSMGSYGWILRYLSDHEQDEIYQRDLEKDLCICRSAVSKIVAELEKKGFIERTKVASDDRLKRILLTDYARQFTEQIRVENHKLELQLMKHFSESEKSQLHVLLERMMQNLAEVNGKENK
ncbi:MAG: MarR family transcriptional regulator [Oscillospiraceae bacterium]|nr:MarR family transcriptional regulator [Oscillospiraceae bacterium]